MNWRWCLRFLGYLLMVVCPLAFLIALLVFYNNPLSRMIGQNIIGFSDHVLGAWTFLPPALSWALSGFLCVGAIHFAIWEAHRFSSLWLRYGILILPVSVIIIGFILGPFIDIHTVGASYIHQAANDPQPGALNVVQGIDLVWIPPGRYFMGSPTNELGHEEDETQHFVTIQYGFWMGRYEITQSQWNSVMEIADLLPPDEANKPVTYVSWAECNEFLGKLNSISKGQMFRLPTESEWEFACRALTETPYSFGDDVSKLQNYAWFSGNSEEKIHPVGQKQPNPLGLYDMMGNVCEWCVDYYGEYPHGSAVDPAGLLSGSCHVTRGGAWNSPSEECRSASRAPLVDDYRVDRKAVGLRVVIGPDLPGVTAPRLIKMTPQQKAALNLRNARRQPGNQQ